MTMRPFPLAHLTFQTIPAPNSKSWPRMSWANGISTFRWPTKNETTGKFQMSRYSVSDDILAEIARRDQENLERYGPPPKPRGRLQRELEEWEGFERNRREALRQDACMASEEENDEPMPEEEKRRRPRKKKKKPVKEEEKEWTLVNRDHAPLAAVLQSREYVCGMCRKVYIAKTSYYQHMRNVHGVYGRMADSVFP